MGQRGCPRDARARGRRDLGCGWRRHLLRVRGRLRAERPDHRGGFPRRPVDEGRTGPGHFQNLRIRGITVGSRASFEAMLAFIETASFRPVIDNTYSFDAVPEAYSRLASADQHGKICIDVRSVR